MKSLTRPRSKIILVILGLTVGLGVNVCDARVSIGIGFGAPIYAPAPVYYGPPPSYYYGPETVTYYGPEPEEDDYWADDQYVEYVSPGPEYVWVNGGWDGHHHHRHHGYWRRQY